MDDPRSGGPGDLDRPVRRAVVGHDHLARAARETDALPCLLHAEPDTLHFVEAWHHDADLDSWFVIRCSRFCE